MNINASLRDVTDRVSVVVGRGQKERRRSSRAVECSKSRIHPRRRQRRRRRPRRCDGVGRNFSCNADYGEHYLLIANPMARAYAHARACVRVYQRYEGVAWRSAVIERARQHDESWNGSLVPPLPLWPGVPAHDLPPFQPLLSLPLQPARSFYPSRSSRGPLPHRSLFLPPFRFASFSHSLSLARSFGRCFLLYLSMYLSLLPGQHMEAALARAPKGRSAVVGEWTNALSAPAAEIKRTGLASSFPPRRNTTKAPPSVHSFVRSSAPLRSDLPAVVSRCLLPSRSQIGRAHV